MLIRMTKAMPPGVRSASLAVASLAIGLALGVALMPGAGLLGYVLGEAVQEHEGEGHALLLALMVGLALIGLTVGAISLARGRSPGWLTAFLLGLAAAPQLTLFAWVFASASSSWGGD